MTTAAKEALLRRAEFWFGARKGEVTDMELSANFSDDEVHYLFMRSLISPKGDRLWGWKTATGDLAS